ncbi:MAG: phosphodiester glycosidase family protein, partial [Acidimicrobiales bacterium]
LRPFTSAPAPGEGVWLPTGRPVHGHPAVYDTTLALPDNPTLDVGIAWMDTRLLSARLYSGSLSPGGYAWAYTAPVSPSAALTLVAAFNGGYLVKDSEGGYFSEGKFAAPLRVGAASLVIYADGNVTVGQWGRDVAMTPSVVAVRQNLNLIVDNGQPVAGLNPYDIATWGASLGNIADTWRSGLGLTADGALVYVSGKMNIVDLADALVRAGSIRAMVLDMNPLWTVFATYSPSPPDGPASPANGTDLLGSMVQTPARFFEAAYSRDFVTMSAR